jgi:hypothetical protein
VDELDVGPENMSVSKLFQSVLIDRFAERLPDYSHDPEAESNTVFREARPNGFFRGVAIQLDIQSPAFRPMIATTYYPKWQGETTMPLGKDAYLTELEDPEALDEEADDWVSFEATGASIRAAVDSMIDDILRLSPGFFESAEAVLVKSTLLQYALRLAAEISASERDALGASLQDARFLVADVEHPAFVSVRDQLRASWDDETTEFEREATNRIAYDCLALVPPKQD